MKFLSTSAVALAVIGGSSAFSPIQHPSMTNAAASKTQLEASKNSMWAPVAGAIAGFSLASQMAFAIVPETPVIMDTTTTTTTTVLSSSSMLTSDSLTLDFSLPSYDAKSTGFGDGSEAYLSSKANGLLTDPGADEKQKQVDAMKKAEEARKVRLAADKQKQKEREAEDKIRAAEKKAERERRMKGIFD